MRAHETVQVAAEGVEFGESMEAADEESGVDRAGHVGGHGDLGDDGNIAHV
jgi:hypothetical protein